MHTRNTILFEILQNSFIKILTVCSKDLQCVAMEKINKIHEGNQRNILSYLKRLRSGLTPPSLGKLKFSREVLYSKHFLNINPFLDKLHPQKYKTYFLHSKRIYKHTMALIDLQNINKQYDTKIILKEANFTLLEGQRIAVIGQNGQGKSTLMKIIMNQTEADCWDCLY
jgi:ABC-type multidrug transport system fused ATPase/permease subunit